MALGANVLRRKFLKVPSDAMLSWNWPCNVHYALTVTGTYDG